MLRFGIVGAGAIAQSACKAINGHAGAQVAALADPNPERLAALCQEHGIARSYAEADALFADPGIDAVYIAVPNSLHAPMAIAAVEAGKHVLLEKPMATCYAEAVAIAEAARRHDRLVMVGMNQRFVRDHQLVTAQVRSGVAGPIYHAKAYWFRRSGIPRLGTWFGNKDLAGGGCLYDIGVHLLDLCLYQLGDFAVESVFGRTHTRFGNRGLGEGKWGKSDPDPTIRFDVDDFATAFIRMASGASVTLEVSWACHQADVGRVGVELFGEEAGLNCKPPRIFQPGDADAEYRVEDLDPEGAIAYPHCCRFTHFIHVLQGIEENAIPLAQSLAVQRVLDGIYESCTTGAVVSVSEESQHVCCA